MLQQLIDWIIKVDWRGFACHTHPSFYALNALWSGAWNKYYVATVDGEILVDHPQYGMMHIP